MELRIGATLLNFLASGSARAIMPTMHKPIRVLVSSDVIGESVVGTLMSPVELFREPLWVIQLDKEASFGPFSLKYLVIRNNQFRKVGE